MAKKTIVDKLREFMAASADDSKKPMTRSEIVKTVAKKKRKAATKKPATAKRKSKRKSKKSKRG
jgi:hypothetical protein